MSKDFGNAGGKEAATYKQPEEAGTPKTGFDSAPKAEAYTFKPGPSIGGTGRGAH